MGIFSAYALSADKLGSLECMYRNIDIPKKSELFWEVFARNLLSDTTDNIISLGDMLDIPMCFPVTFIPIFSVRYYWLFGEYNPCWKKYSRAGTNFPFLRIFPSFLRGRMAMDGGAVDNIPLYPLLRKGNLFTPEEEELDLIIVLHFDARYDYRKEFSSDVPILDIDVSICNDFKKNHYNFSSQYIGEMLAAAEEYGDCISRRVFGGDCSREALQKKVNEIFMEEHERRQQHPSADGLISILNIVGKALRKDSACIKKLY